jgi:hypothetical protein
MGLGMTRRARRWGGAGIPSRIENGVGSQQVKGTPAPKKIAGAVRRGLPLGSGLRA